MLNLLAYDTHFNEHLAATVLESETGREDVVCGLFRNEHTLWHAYTTKNVVDECLELVETCVLVSVNPGTLNALTCKPETEVVLFLVSLHRILVVALLLVVLVAVTELEETEVRILTVCVAHD